MIVLENSEFVLDYYIIIWRDLKCTRGSLCIHAGREHAWNLFFG